MKTSLLFVVGICLLSSAAGAEAPALPAPIEVDAAERAKMAVCTDGKSHYVVIGPHERVSHQLYYGDGKNLSQVLSDAHGMLPGTDFLEPRFIAPTYNDNFRGLDMRIYSGVEYKAEDKTCTLRCGEVTHPLTVLTPAEANKLVTGATFRKSPRAREAYVLARDDHGVYYYVDRGNTEQTKQSFRIFVGRKGAMKLQKMKDVASDSEGEVYSTASGDLRLVTSKREKPEFSWIRNGKETKLTVLPIMANLNLVYTTLGVYTGERFGTPCDDL
jgi:hypothetical protein